MLWICLNFNAGAVCLAECARQKEQETNPFAKQPKLKNQLSPCQGLATQIPAMQSLHNMSCRRSTYVDLLDKEISISTTNVDVDIMRKQGFELQLMAQSTQTGFHFNDGEILCMLHAQCPCIQDNDPRQ